MSWVPDFGYNLLSTIFLALKKVKMLLKKAGMPIQIYYDNKIHELTDIIDWQYVLQIKPSEVTTHFANTMPIMNAVKLILDIKHQQINHLSYQNVLKFLKIANKIEVNRLTFNKICGSCIKEQ